MALLLLGLVFGWPLIWATISTEGTDTFDALSRSYAYVFQRPLRYLFYAIVAAVLGWLGWLLVQNFAAAVIWLTYWAAGWGAAGDRIDLIRGIKIADVKDLAGISYAGGAMIRFWVGCVQFLAAGYFYGYFFTAASAMYLLLRRDVDATEMDEVFLDADQGEQTKEPASVESEANGTPATDEAIASAKADPAGNSDNTPA